MLFGVSPANAETVIKFLVDSGFESTVVVGEVTEEAKQPSLQLR